MRRLFFIIGLVVTGFGALAQQDAQYSQYIFNGIYISPAYSGYKQDFYVHSFARSQWTGFPGAPQSFSIAGDASVADTKVGLGMLIAADKIGAQSSLATNFNLAYHLPIGQDDGTRLSFGMSLGFVQAAIDGTKLNAVQEGDNYIPTSGVSALFPDARAGVMFSTNTFYAGFSADNLVAQNMQQDKSLLVPVPKPHYYLTAGTIFDLNDDTKLNPSFLIKDDRAGPTSLDLNMFMLLSERLWVGGTYRTAIPLYNKPNLPSGLQKTNAAIAMVEFFVTEKLRIGYAFDYSTTTLGNYNYGTHEISLGIYLHKGDVTPGSEKCYFR
ncbi:type IX secretion system membrane protein PorP/SprF [Mucilaginibacter sp. AW1-3]